VYWCSTAEASIIEVAVGSEIYRSARGVIIDENHGVEICQDATTRKKPGARSGETNALRAHDIPRAVLDLHTSSVDKGIT
jgi:hypothetical protein